MEDADNPANSRKSLLQREMVFLFFPFFSRK